MMVRTFFFTLLALLIGSQMLAQNFEQADRWTEHLSYYDGKKAIRSGNRMFCLMGENLLIYHLDNQREERITRLSHGLSAKSISQMAYSETEDLLVLFYSNRHIDLFSPTTGRVVPINYLQRFTEELTINRLSVLGSSAFLSTTQGVIWIDLSQRSIRGYYRIGDCNDALLFDNTLFAATADGKILTADPQQNLSDLNAWHSLLQMPIAQLIATNNYLYALVDHRKDIGVWRISPRVDTSRNVERIIHQPILSAQYDHLTGQVQFLSSQHLYHSDEANNSYPTLAWGQQLARSGINAYLYHANDGIWLGEDGKGFRYYPISADSINTSQAQSIIGETGPLLDKAYFLRQVGGQLLIASGRFDTYEVDQTPQTAQLFDGTNWRFLRRPKATDDFWGKHFQWATSIAQDPTNSQHYVVTTGRTGVYAYDLSQPGAFWGNHPLSEKAVQQFSYHNSPLQSALGNTHASAADYVRTDGAIFDQQGNLFLLNNQVDTLIWVRKRNGQWTGLFHQDLSKAPTLEKTMFDSQGRLWVTSRRTVSYHNAGFLCLDYNGTIDNTADDRAKYRSSFVNQDGTNFLFQAAYCLAEDKDGSMWLGTDQGLLKVEKNANWFADNFRITQVKVPRNDGTNLADYLMAGVPISALAIDGAGRKWVGTDGNGLYLLSADGLEVIHHFTSDNSPLYSDKIWSLALHNDNGQVYISTDQGLLAYRSDATTPSSQLTKQHIKIYPNPLRPEHRGNIHITGLPDNCDVRITSPSGVVVKAGKSLGGMFEWDTRDLGGNRVGSGVYLVHLVGEGDNQAMVSKIAIVR